jgi:hypothetical protein
MLVPAHVNDTPYHIDLRLVTDLALSARTAAFSPVAYMAIYCPGGHPSL